MNILINLLSLVPQMTYDMVIWLIQNPHLAIPILLLEFIVLMKTWHSIKDDDRWYVLPIKIFIGFLFVPQDITVRHTAMAFIMLDTPQFQKEKPFLELTVTAQMQRYKQDYSKVPQNPRVYSPLSNLNYLEMWRYWFAYTICRALHWADKGHC